MYSQFQGRQIAVENFIEICKSNSRPIEDAAANIKHTVLDLYR